jgi:AcrR family transcriptional regulator
MAMPRQDPSSEKGRVNQKRRTRSAIVEAARQLMADGVTPTVAQAAEAALVSRTTAYRYFPTQESLLMDVVLDVDVHDVEELASSPVDAAGAQARAVAVLGELSEHVAAAEAQYRASMRFYQDAWLEAAGAGGEEPAAPREGRRLRWLQQSLEPLRGSVDDESWQRVIHALCMLTGTEAHIVMRDVCHISAEEGRAVAAWAAETLLKETFRKRR